MEKRELQVEIREETGKGGARRLRMRDYVPAVFYGPHLEAPVSLAAKSLDVQKMVQAGGTALITLKSVNKNVDGKTAFLKDEQFHPLSGKVVHVDLYEVRMDEEIKVNVPVQLTGKAKGVLEGGVLQVIVRELSIRCLPDRVPQALTVDVSHLEIGDSIHVSEMKLPEGVKVTSTVNYTIAAVVTPAEEVKEEAPAVAPDAVAVDGAPAAVPGAPGAAPGTTPGAPGAAPGVAAAAPGAPGAKAAPGAAPAGKEGKKPEGKKAGGKKSEGK
jgi:large subunit ribosomal protein L25